MTWLGSSERIWLWYCVAVAGVTAWFSDAGADWETSFHPGRFCWLHLGVVSVSLGTAWCFRADATRLRVARSLTAVIGLPVVFSSLAWVLPGIHPEPWEWRWLELDRALFGVDPTVEAQRLLSPVVVEVLQWSYACFYLIPLTTVLAAGRASGAIGLDRCRDLIVFGFLLSYLGYLLWPCLPPYHYLEHDVMLRGVFAAERLHAWIDEAELHRWNCFPSGHTMLTVLSLLLAWRWVRPMFWVLLPVGILLIASTIGLRYHYGVDVLAGLLGAPIALWLGGLVTDPASGKASG